MSGNGRSIDKLTAAASMIGRPAAMPFNTPLMLTLIMVSHSSTFRAFIGDKGMTPALLKMTSTRPNLSLAKWTLSYPRDQHSQLWILLSRPGYGSPQQSFLAFCTPCSQTTFAPVSASNLAVASPMPLLAPVIAMTLFSKFNMVIFLLFRLVWIKETDRQRFQFSGHSPIGFFRVKMRSRRRYHPEDPRDQSRLRSNEVLIWLSRTEPPAKSVSIAPDYIHRNLSVSSSLAMYRVNTSIAPFVLA